MHIMLCLGGVKICLDCEKEIQIEDVFLPFIIRERSGISGQDEKWKETDILAVVSWKWVKPPLRSAVKLGEDLIQTYYRREEKNYCIVWEGEKGAISCVEYDDTFSHVSCRIQERLLPVAPKSLGEMVREVNKNEVERQEVLSDRVYSYDKEKHQIRQEPDSIQKVKEMER